MSKASSKATVYLSLGSNIGDRLKNLSIAKEVISSQPNIKITAESKIYEAEPWFEIRRPYSESKNSWYLNQVIKISTSLNPDELLKITCKIGRQLSTIRASSPVVVRGRAATIALAIRRDARSSP